MHGAALTAHQHARPDGRHDKNGAKVVCFAQQSPHATRPDPRHREPYEEHYYEQRHAPGQSRRYSSMRMMSLRSNAACWRAARPRSRLAELLPQLRPPASVPKSSVTSAVIRRFDAARIDFATRAAASLPKFNQRSTRLASEMPLRGPSSSKYAVSIKTALPSAKTMTLSCLRSLSSSAGTLSCFRKVLCNLADQTLERHLAD